MSLIIHSGLFHTGWKWGYTYYAGHRGWIQHILYVSDSCTHTSSRIRYVLWVSDLVLINRWQMLSESREIWAWDAESSQAYGCSSKILSKFVAPSEKLLPICSGWLSQQTKSYFLMLGQNFQMEQKRNHLKKTGCTSLICFFQILGVNKGSVFVFWNENSNPTLLLGHTDQMSAGPGTMVWSVPEPDMELGWRPVHS